MEELKKTMIRRYIKDELENYGAYSSMSSSWMWMLASVFGMLIGGIIIKFFPEISKDSSTTPYLISLIMISLIVYTIYLIYTYRRKDFHERNLLKTFEGLLKK